ncbi:hypothetical protein BC826DRAFT_1108425 [Russula brevipes]|nr:hypothetical protein BC826DRAFT_1108425 [Russula brevipes]
MEERYSDVTVRTPPSPSPAIVCLHLRRPLSFKPMSLATKSFLMSVASHTESKAGWASTFANVHTRCPTPRPTKLVSPAQPGIALEGISGQMFINTMRLFLTEQHASAVLKQTDPARLDERLSVAVALSSPRLTRVDSRVASPAHRHPGQRFCLGLMHKAVVGYPSQRGPDDKIGQLSLLDRYGGVSEVWPLLILLNAEVANPVLFLASGLWVLFESEEPGCRARRYDAFNGLVPPIWGCPVPKRSGHDVDVFRWADERQPCPSWFEEEAGAELSSGAVLNPPALTVYRLGL